MVKSFLQYNTTPIDSGGFVQILNAVNYKYPSLPFGLFGTSYLLTLLTQDKEKLNQKLQVLFANTLPRFLRTITNELNKVYKSVNGREFIKVPNEDLGKLISSRTKYFSSKTVQKFVYTLCRPAPRGES